MKKQNVNNKLAFNKAAVTELNDMALRTINGGAAIEGLGSTIIGGGDTCTGCCCVSVSIRVTRDILVLA